MLNCKLLLDAPSAPSPIGILAVLFVCVGIVVAAITVAVIFIVKALKKKRKDNPNLSNNPDGKDK